MEEKELPLRKFRVIAGTHREGKKSYTKGKVVKSTRNLVKLFVGKFVEVGKPDNGDEEEVADTAKTKSAKAAKNQE